MKTRLLEVQSWFKQRNPREQYVLLVIGFLAVYLIWDALVDQRLLTAQNKSKQQLTQLQQKLDETKAQIFQITTIIQSSHYKNVLQKSKRLSQQSQTVKQQVHEALPRFTDEKNIPLLLRDLSVKQANIK